MEEKKTAEESHCCRPTLKFSELAAALDVDRNFTIDSRIRDVIDDYDVLSKEKNTDNAGKCTRDEALPPNTPNFRQNKLIKDLTELGMKLREEIEQCDREDVIRKKRLEEVTTKTHDLARQFVEAENAYNGVLKERENHNALMEAFSNDVQYYAKTSRRYALCGEALSEVGKVMEEVINENKCFDDFIRSLAGQNMSSSAASHELAAFIAEFESIETAKKNISDQMDQALSNGEKAQLAVLQTKNEFIRELKFTVEELITSHAHMEHASVMNTGYEKALNTMSVDTVNALTSLVRVLSSAEKIVDKLIENKIVDHSYRKKTLAQQFEAIRDDYIKKKAILHEYHKAKARKDKKRAFMVKALDKEEELQEFMDHQKLRIADLARKRVKMAWMEQRDQEEKRSKRELRNAQSVSGVAPDRYNPLEDHVALLDLEEEDRFPMQESEHDPDDYEYPEDSSEDEADLAVYCGSTHDNLLVQESEAPVSFMTAAESEVSVASFAKKVVIERESTSSGDSASSDVNRDRRMSAYFHDSLSVSD